MAEPKACRSAGWHRQFRNLVVVIDRQVSERTRSTFLSRTRAMAQELHQRRNGASRSDSNPVVVIEIGHQVQHRDGKPKDP